MSEIQRSVTDKAMLFSYDHIPFERCRIFSEWYHGQKGDTVTALEILRKSKAEEKWVVIDSRASSRDPIRGIIREVPETEDGFAYIDGQKIGAAHGAYYYVRVRDIRDIEIGW